MRRPLTSTLQRRTRPAAAAFVALCLAGCGSTVQYTRTTAGLRTDGGLAVGQPGSSTDPAYTGAGAPATGAGLAGSAGNGTGPASSLAGGTSGRAPAGGTGSTRLPSAVAGATSGRGFTATTIRIGVGTANDANAFAGSFGLKGVGYSGDPNVWLQALTDDINRKGGLLGRKIVLVKHDYNTAQLLSDPATANQQACAAWTQDDPVFAVLLAGLYVEDTLLSCLAKTGTPLVFPGASQDYPLHYRAAYAKYPLFFDLAQMVGERYDRIAVDRLAARSFFAPWNTATGSAGTASANPVKVGLLGFDDSDGAVQEASRKRELARHGLHVDAAASIRCPRALTAKIQCMQSAVLRFASNGVTHVFGADTVFMNNAQNQRYHPRYFVQVSTAAFAENEGANQLNGAMGEGYVPTYDVEPSEYPGDTAPAKACRALMRAAGQAATDHSTLALQFAMCDEFAFTKAALEKVGAIGANALRSGMEQLGSTQQSALTFASFLSPTEHASAPVLRDLVYRADTGRFVYTSRTNYGDAA